jgi:hypothetical protein
MMPEVAPAWSSDRAEEEREFHPVADIFPMMSDREFIDLIDDIREHGLREPVWLHRDGRIIDGRNRYKACRRLGDEPAYRTYEGDDDGLVPFVISLNLHRRHLSESQRAMVAARIARYSHGGDRVSEQAANLPLATQALAAEQLQVSERSVRDAKKVQDEGSPSLAAAVDEGRVAVSTAAALTDLPPQEQRELIDANDKDAIVKRANQIKAEKRERKQQEREERQRIADQVAAATPPLHAPEIVVETGEWWQLGEHLLYCGDSSDPAFVERARGAAFAFADPPYNAGKADWDSGFEWCHDYLSEIADIAAVTPGISAVADFFASTAMPYRWSMSAWITNGMTRGALGFGNWIYVALFSTQESIHRNAQDHLRITVNAATTDETNHASRKPASLLVELLDLFTATGDTVVDPFLGSGTTLFAAEQTGRRCVGAELDPGHCREIIARFGPEARPL